jgi:hypothetical protein
MAHLRDDLCVILVQRTRGTRDVIKEKVHQRLDQLEVVLLLRGELTIYKLTLVYLLVFKVLLELLKASIHVCLESAAVTTLTGAGAGILRNTDGCSRLLYKLH